MATSGPSVRRARALITYWEDGDLVAENFLAGTRATISPPVVGVLSKLTEATSRADVVALLGGDHSAQCALDALVEQGLLLDVDSELARRDSMLHSTWAWGTDARFFHFSTREVPYESDIERQRASLAEHAAATPPPSPFAQRHFDRRVSLPGSFAGQSGSPWDTLRRRRTERRFARVPISLEALATVLRWTWGYTEKVDRAEIGPFLLKTSPSGGARHPIEAYVAAMRVENLEAGIYHYNVEHDALDRIGAAVSGDEAATLFAHQPWVRDAAALFFMTAVVARSMWKYKHSHAYRVLLLDAGHLGQTFHLACAGAGLAPFTSSAKDDPAIERLLGIDGVGEISLYAAATGLAASISSTAARKSEAASVSSSARSRESGTASK